MLLVLNRWEETVVQVDAGVFVVVVFAEEVERVNSERCACAVYVSGPQERLPHP